MPANTTLRNDNAMAQVQLNSQIQSQDFTGRIGQDRGDVQGAIRKYKDNSSAVATLRFPSSEVAKYYMTMQISDYARTDLFNVNFNTRASIILPLAKELENNHSVSYDVAEVGMLLGTGANMMGKNIPTNQRTLQGAADYLYNAGHDALARATNPNIPLNENEKNLGIAAGIDVGQIITPKGLENVASAFLGYSPNQFFTVLLKGPDYAKYQFTWTLFPKNFAESNTIKNIYLMVMNAKAPAAALGGALWKFPSMFRLAFMPNSQYMFKFKPAVCVSADFNFSSGGQTPAFYNSTAPESVTMTLSFMELEYWLSSDYIGTNDPYQTTGSARGV